MAAMTVLAALGVHGFGVTCFFQLFWIWSEITQTVILPLPWRVSATPPLPHNARSFQLPTSSLLAV